MPAAQSIPCERRNPLPMQCLPLISCEASDDSSEATDRVELHYWRGEHIVAAQPVVHYQPNRVAAAYRRLALVILGLDVRTLTHALRIDPCNARSSPVDPPGCGSCTPRGRR